MFEAIKKILTANFISPLLARVTNFFTQDANLAAQKYASDAVKDIAVAIPNTLEVLGKAIAAVKLAGLGVDNALALTSIVVGKESKEKQALLSPMKMYHDYKNYQFLAGVKEGNYATREEDDFVVIEEKAPKLK